MKILLTAINAKYIHTNLAVYSLKAFAKEYREQIKLAEFTINHYTDDILQSIYREKPDFIGFSCYIWNIAVIEELCVELRKLLPEARIWLGGPEVSYDAKKRLEIAGYADGIMIGEGEETFKELLDYYIARKGTLHAIKGIVFREDAGVTETLPRPAAELDKFPFPYEDIGQFKNKIIYYESIRGCPYSCSYCLSSVDKGVRLRSIELVQRELDLFLSHKVMQVKFVDRTFNCNRLHALSVWRYIKEHDNGITNFHFEISADILDEEELTLLNSMRKGLVQLEIGVQSTNPETIKAICRHMDLGRLSHAVDRISEGNNIHQHLDLIAGLPYEDYASFRNSFNDVYAMKPNQLQLGFLKVLKGSGMLDSCKKFGICYKSVPPYEVLYTDWMSYDEILSLKIVEDMVETYYNSGQFNYGIKYLEHFFETPFDLYRALGYYYEWKGLKGINHSRIRRYEILIEFMDEYRNAALRGTYSREALCGILVHDLFLRENLKSRPDFANDQEQYKIRYRNFYLDEQKLREYLDGEAAGARIAQLKQYLHLEHFDIDVRRTAETGTAAKADQFVLYDYRHRDPLNSEARTMLIRL